ncbi:hypothetical protein EAI_11803 [Harpegnathos saltator]|uniref:Uncharacterized protein n=1 Tax=Harpegnathos saltator TaxID=610380 RepID=E2B5N9_HARSA|nr:hypothetical protein EAI_11803 [Harpegnathos saltator]
MATREELAVWTNLTEARVRDCANLIKRDVTSRSCSITEIVPNFTTKTSHLLLAD